MLISFPGRTDDLHFFKVKKSRFSHVSKKDQIQHEIQTIRQFFFISWFTDPPTQQHVQTVKRFFGSAKLMIYAFLLRNLKKEQDLFLMCQISIKYNCEIQTIRQFFFISWFTDPPTQIFAF